MGQGTTPTFFFFFFFFFGGGGGGVIMSKNAHECTRMRHTLILKGSDINYGDVGGGGGM